ncbi:hypothetical protein ACFFX0_15185 [Citricoccus parietis]|uniref:Uncharacterized protein n=1 Tax=Citricoccus parietis TaxID=592307 RepID=A0ABV5G0L6_9MICC
MPPQARGLVHRDHHVEGVQEEGAGHTVVLSEVLPVGRSGSVAAPAVAPAVAWCSGDSAGSPTTGTACRSVSSVPRCWLAGSFAASAAATEMTDSTVR